MTKLLFYWIMILSGIVIITNASPTWHNNLHNSGTTRTTNQTGSNQDKRLIKFRENESGIWLTKQQIDEASVAGLNFMDVTDDDRNGAEYSLNHRIKVKTFDIPSSPRFPSTVKEIQSQLNISRIESFLSAFTSYHNRYYKSETGVASANRLYEELQGIIDNSGYQGDPVSVQKFTHAWPQPSIIARVQGKDPSLLVLGGHLDSIASGGEKGVAPGADDNGSGTTTLVETFHVLLNSGFKPKYTLEFHWYAAEEVGLRGSTDIMSSYKATGQDVVAMINFDMTGYAGVFDKRIAIIRDSTDKDLSLLISLLVNNYTDYRAVMGNCGYGCSDHASWHKGGYRAAFPVEGFLYLSTSPFIHTRYDLSRHIKYARIFEFCKLAVSAVVELAEPFDTFESVNKHFMYNKV